MPLHLRFASAALAMSLVSPLAFAAVPGVDNPARPDGKKHTFVFGGENNESFLLDGKPLQIRAGEIHYQRIPKETWRRSIQLAKAMGLNTVGSYTFWNDLEKADGTFDFKTGSRDLAAFLKLCQEEGMWYLFRPGPYVCGEWDFGGIPPQLLKHEDIKIRTTQDKRFMEAQEKYLDAVAKVAEPFLVKNGGPILLTQIENEYGSYQRKDHAYLHWLKDYWTKKGFGPFNMADGASDNYLKGNTIPGVAVGLDEGTSDAHWEAGRRNNPGVPVFSSETYPGWLRHWGEGDWKNTDKQNEMHFYMNGGKSFSLYVFHGGTNFGFTAGANGSDGGYQPDLTSYDYAAPVNEQGNKSHAYREYRQIISSYLPADQQPPAIPEDLTLMEIPGFTPKRIGSLSDRLPTPMKQADPKFFESWGQNQGLAIYTTELPAGPAGKLVFDKIADYSQIYLDGKQIAKTDRRRGKPKPIDIPERAQPAKLSLLVEGMGHINFSITMEGDRKGIVGTVTFNGAPVKNWLVYPLPLLAKEVCNFKPVTGESAGVGSRFRGTFKIDGKPTGATFIDMSKYVKGFVWINGHNLGRHWNAGPQERLFCPQSFLKAGENVIDIIDLEAADARPVRGTNVQGRSANKDTKNLNNVW
ncbi:MAG: beta-galactosidase [Verrucomicrobiota bacterium]